MFAEAVPRCNGLVLWTSIPPSGSAPSPAQGTSEGSSWEGIILFLVGNLEESALYLKRQNKLMTVLCRELISRRIEWFSQLWTLERFIT